MGREWVFDEYKGFEALKLRECEKEEPGPNDVRLKVEAFALNWGDADLMEDFYSFSFTSLPARVGIEASGIVEAVGSEVEGIEVGGRYGTLPYFYDMRGASADTLLIDSNYVARAPEGLSPVEAASIWMQFMTAYYPVVELGGAAPGVNIFVPAGTSTAGSAGIEIGKLKGATIISTTRSESNRAYLQDLGADHVFVDDGGNLEEFLLDITDGVGVHASFDPVGGNFMERYAHAMAKGGKLMLYGGLEGSFSPAPILSMFQKNLWFHAYSLFNYVQEPEAQKRGVDFVTNALNTAQLKPRIDKIFPMEEYIEAWRYLRGKRSSYGKVLVETGV